MTDDERLEAARRSAAGLLYVRNRLAGELATLRADAEQLRESAREALLRGDEWGTRVLAERRVARVAEAERVARELAAAEHDAAEAVAALIALHEEIRSQARERLRRRAAELAIDSATAREVAEDPLEARFRALERG